MCGNFRRLQSLVEVFCTKKRQRKTKVRIFAVRVGSATGDAGILSGDFEIVLARSQEDYEVHTLEELLPLSFGPENLKKQGGE